MPRLDLLLKNCTLIDPANKVNGPRELGIAQDKIVAVEEKLDSREAKATIDLKGRTAIPGVIDPHVHIGDAGHRNMAKVGVITAVDFTAPMSQVLESTQDFGSGMNVAAITAIGTRIKRKNPSRREIREMLENFLTSGALGVKLIGTPLPMETLAEVTEEANKMKAYVALDCGVTQSGSNIKGLTDVVGMVGNRLHLHIAHINSYCRGQVKDPVEEALEALSLLKDRRNIQSESYLGIINGTPGQCVNGAPSDGVTQDCLRLGGYPATEDGLKQAITDGYCKVPFETGGETVLLEKEEALRAWVEAGTKRLVSFPVNVPAAAILLATRKDEEKRFIVNGVSTDGGSTPRNVSVESGLALVRYGALSLEELVTKLAWNPSRMFGMLSKGHLGLGADADVTVLDMTSGRAIMGIALGKVIMVDGVVVGRGGTVITTESGVKAVEKARLPSQVAGLSESGLYA